MIFSDVDTTSPFSLEGRFFVGTASATIHLDRHLNGYSRYAGWHSFTLVYSCDETRDPQWIIATLLDDVEETTVGSNEIGSCGGSSEEFHYSFGVTSGDVFFDEICLNGED
jgi:hypothetical protein